MTKTISFIKQYKVTIGLLMVLVVLPIIASVADKRLELDAAKLGYLGFVAFSILAMTLPLENNYWKAKEDCMDEYLAKRFRELGVTLQKRKQRRQELRRIKDKTNPKRVENRQKRARVMELIKIYSFFIGLCVVAPFTGVAVGLWQENAGNEAGGTIVAISIVALVQTWGVVIDKVIKIKHEASEK